MHYFGLYDHVLITRKNMFYNIKAAIIGVKTCC